MRARPIGRANDTARMGWRRLIQASMRARPIGRANDTARMGWRRLIQASMRARPIGRANGEHDAAGRPIRLLQ